MKKILSFIVVMLIALTARAAETINITPGDDKLIAALSTASAGDVIVLGDGTYNEYSNYIDFNKTITVKAADGAKPVVNVGCYIKVQGGGDIKIQGIKFDGTEQGHNGSSYSYFIRVYDNSATTTLELEGCEICNTKGNRAIYIAGDKHLSALKINNCYFHDGSNSAIDIAKGTVDACDKVEITNSTFANYGGYNYGMISIYNASGSTTDDIVLKVDHCTFYNNTKTEEGSTYGCIDVRKSINNTITNCIFACPATLASGAYANRATQLYGGTVANCLIFNTPNHRTDAITLTGALKDVDPKFVNEAVGNLALAEDSPARGAGTDASNLGDPRWWTIPPTKYYMKHNWMLDDEWTWKEMTAVGDGTYKLENVTYSGAGVDFNTAEDDAGKTYVAADQILGLKIAKKDIVSFVLDPAAGTVTATMVAPYVSVVADGFYLVGKINGVDAWDYADLSADKLFKENTEAPGEYMLDYKFAKGDEIKVIRLFRDDYEAWYNDGGGNYVITEELAGDVTIYFRPEGNAEWGYFYFTVIKKMPTAIDNTAVDAEILKTFENGQLIIIKNGVRYNAQGAVVR